MGTAALAGLDLWSLMSAFGRTEWGAVDAREPVKLELVRVQPFQKNAF